MWAVDCAKLAGLFDRPQSRPRATGRRLVYKAKSFSAERQAFAVGRTGWPAHWGLASQSEAISEHNRKGIADCFVPNIHGDALNEKRVTRTNLAHWPDNPIQQCYAPLLHSGAGATP